MKVPTMKLPIAQTACIALALSLSAGLVKAAGYSLDDIEKLVGHRQFIMAQKQLEPLLKADAKNPRANLLYAKCLIEAGRFDEATEKLTITANATDSKTASEAKRMLKVLPIMKKSLGNSSKDKPLGYTGLGLSPGGKVADVLVGSSAARAGIRPGDKIVQVDGKPAPADYQQLLEKIRGPRNTEVTLGVERPGSKNFTCKVLRAASLQDLGSGSINLNAWSADGKRKGQK
jgi:membrane-associated protease RseP (regulator of RpoE activity)